MNNWVLGILAATLISGGIAHGADPTLFPLGLWYEGGVGDARDNVLPKDPSAAAPIYEKNFADIEAHGINLVVVPNSPPSHHQNLLDTAEKHHLKVICELGLDGGEAGWAIRGPDPVDQTALREVFKKVLDPIKSHPAFERLQLIDEPATGLSMAHFAAVKQILEQTEPGVKSFCCLAGIAPLVEYRDITRPDVIAFDYYPYGLDTPLGDVPTIRAFESASLTAARQAAEGNAKSWAVIQCHAMTGVCRSPTPAELSAMTWCALGTGSKGIFFFLYQTEHVTKAHEMQGLVDRDFKPRPLWNEVALLTREIQPLTAILADLKPAAEKETIIRRKSMFPLQDSKGNPYLIAVNVDPAEKGTQTLHLSMKTPGTKVYRLPARREIPSVRKGDMLTWHEQFPPGTGALYEIK